MRQNIGNIFRKGTRFLNNPKKRRILTLTCLAVFFLFLLILLLGGTAGHGEHADAESTMITSTSTTPTIIPTKWWIRVTPAPSLLTAPAEPSSLPTSNCPSSFSSPLQPGIYAYVSLTPPLPNRIHSGAGKRNSYLGQVEPGGGVKVIEGPLCVDGFSWWLVESTQNGLQGWTAEGTGPEQWVIPCRDRTRACEKKPVPDSSSQETSIPYSDAEDQNKSNKCRPDRLTVGILARVGQDSLLVIRSKPNAGNVLERIGPLSIVTIIDGPSCTGSTVWFKVYVSTLNLSGWATENNLDACSKENGCN